MYIPHLEQAVGSGEWGVGSGEWGVGITAHLLLLTSDPTTGSGQASDLGSP
jgi:hypothetical protein